MSGVMLADHEIERGIRSAKKGGARYGLGAPSFCAQGRARLDADNVSRDATDCPADAATTKAAGMK